MNLRLRLLLGHAAVAAFVAVVGVFADQTSRKVHQEVEQISLGPVIGAVDALAMSDAARGAYLAAAELANIPDLSVVERERGEIVLSRHLQTFSASLDRSRQATRYLTPTSSLTEQAAGGVPHDAGTSLDDLRRDFTDFRTLAVEVAQSTDTGPAAIRADLRRLRTLLEQQILPAIHAFRSRAEASLTVQVRSVQRSLDRMRYRNRFMAIAAVAGAMGIAFVLARSVARPLAILQNAAQEVGRGELDVQIAWKSRDELGQLADAFRKMLSDLKTVTVSKEVLQQAHDEKEVLLREIHHRVKNNLQVVSSLLRMQSRDASDEQAARLFQESQNRIRSMARIHEQLHRASDLAHVDFGQYTRELVADLAKAYSCRLQKIAVSVQVDAVDLPLDMAIPCGLIVNELVSNAFTHAFPGPNEGEPKISVVYTVEKGAHRLSVCDNGVGLPSHFNVAQPSSVGFRVVAALAQQIGGTLECASSDGAAIFVRFPAPHSNRPHERAARPNPNR